jgi:hypothetical protein
LSTDASGLLSGLSFYLYPTNEVFDIDIAAYAVMSNQQNAGSILQQRSWSTDVRQEPEILPLGAESG